MISCITTNLTFSIWPTFANFCCLYLNSANSGRVLPTWKANGIIISKLVFGFWHDTLRIPRYDRITLFFLDATKKLYCSHLVQSLREGSRVLKSCLLAAEGFQAALTLGGLLNGHWSPEAPSHDWGWAFRRHIRPTQPGAQPACRGGSGGHPSFCWVSSPHLESGSLGSHRWGGLHRQNPGQADPKGPGSNSSLWEGQLP